MSAPHDAASLYASGASWWRAAFEGAWLDRHRVRVYASLLLAIEITGFAFVIAGTHGWIVPLPGATTTDFISFYAAGTLANAGTPGLAYDHAAHLLAEETIVGAGIGYQYFNYPPIYILPFTLLARLPYLVAFVLFEGATLAFYLIVATRILNDRSWTALAALLAFPIVFWNLGLGQNAFLSAALLGAATLSIERRPVLAGMLLGMLCYKPQFGLLLPLALAAGREWRAFAGASATVVLLVLISVAMFGPATWLDFFTTAGGAHSVYESGRILFAGMANVFGGARTVGAPVPLAYALQIATSLTVAAIVVVAWHRRLSLASRAAVLTAGAVIAAPLSLLYDLMLTSVAALWLIRDRAVPAAAPWEGVAISVVYLAVLEGRWMGESWHIPVYPMAAAALFAIAASRAWREMRRR